MILIVLKTLEYNGELAQLVERNDSNVEARGSKPRFSIVFDLVGVVLGPFLFCLVVFLLMLLFVGLLYLASCAELPKHIKFALEQIQVESGEFQVVLDQVDNQSVYIREMIPTKIFDPIDLQEKVVLKPIVSQLVYATTHRIALVNLPHHVLHGFVICHLKQIDAFSLHSHLISDQQCVSDANLKKNAIQVVPHYGFLCHDKSSSSASSGRLRVMSANLWNFNHWKARVHKLRQVFSSHLPDVIGFQEVRTKYLSRNQNALIGTQLDEIREFLGSEFVFHVFEPAMAFVDGDDYVEEGLAIFSRFPIVYSDFIKLSQIKEDGDDFHQRVCLRAMIDSPIGLISVMNTHLSLSRDARKLSVQEIIEFSKSSDVPTILLGDFNAENAELELLMKGSGFKDCTDDQNTFTAWNPHKKIDYVFLRDSKTEDSVDVQHHSVIGFPCHNPEDDDKEVHSTNDICPSDHEFVQVEFSRSTQKDEL